jgi:hypothetical protein
MVNHYATIREAQGHHREVLSGGSVYQSDEPTNRNVIEGQVRGQVNKVQ